MHVWLLTVLLLCYPQQKVNEHTSPKHKQQHPAGNSQGKALPISTGNTPDNQPDTTYDPTQNKAYPFERTYKIEVPPQPPERWFKIYVVATVAIAGLNLALLVVVWLQRQAMIRQIKEMQDVRKLEYRAWIQIEEIAAYFEESGILKPLVSIENTGRTPAKGVKVWFVVEKTRNMESPNFHYADENRMPAQPIIPPRLPLQLGGEKSKFGLVRSQWVEMENRELSVFIHGKISYTDMFGDAHWMTFCLVYEPSIRKFAIYKEHNETDD